MDSLQDVPSFLQEVTTVRGQLLYGTAQLRADAGVDEGFDASDEVAVAQLERLVSLDTMRQRQAANAARAAARGGSADGVRDADSSQNAARKCASTCMRSSKCTGVTHPPFYGVAAYMSKLRCTPGTYLVMAYVMLLDARCQCAIRAAVQWYTKAGRACPETRALCVGPHADAAQGAGAAGASIQA